MTRVAADKGRAGFSGAVPADHMVPQADMRAAEGAGPADEGLPSGHPGAFDEVFEAIRRDPQNAAYTARGADPLFRASATARLLVVGQAPGHVAEETGLTWNDRSGERLRGWLGLDRATFYDTARVAIVPMDFYFPGSGGGGDLPPRAGFAERWHPMLLGMMPELRLAVLVGSYAIRFYLGLRPSVRLCDVVADWRAVLAGEGCHAARSGVPGAGLRCFPLVHPSPRNRRWLRDHPWFEDEVVPALQGEVRQSLEGL